MSEKCDDYTKTKAFKLGRWLATPSDGEEIVMSGLAGIYPDSNDVYHFRDNLYNKIDMISCDNRRWEPNHPEIPQRTGKIFNVEKFDAGYFGVYYHQAQTMDPMSRLFLEKAVEAVFDAGIHPSELEGSNTGVFVGACFSETEKNWFYDRLYTQTYAITGCMRSMIPNRLSYHLKLKGPSYITDSACSSSLYALENAYRAIRNGECDMAIVGGTNMCLHPCVSLQFARLGVLSPDGACKAFDENGNGYTRSEAVIALVLQKAKNARRNYGQVVHAKTNCDGYKEQGITYPSGQTQKMLLKEFYEECGVDPTNLSFLEAHGTGTRVGDPEEVAAIDEVFCKNRTKPLMIGSVKSNIGHTEPSSGLCSVTKVILGMENGLIPPNINFTTPRVGVEALEKGRLKVVTEKTPFEDNRNLIGISSFGFGGGNCHVLLHWNEKIKIDSGKPRDDLPRLVCVSGRVKESVFSILDDLKSRKLDVEYIKLLQQIFCKNVEGHYHRGFTIVSKSGKITKSYTTFDGCQKPCYIYFGDLTSSWQIIFKDLIALPIFAATIQRIHDILLPQGLNVTELLLNNTKETVSTKIFGSSVVQIALADILKLVKIEPKQIFGHGFNKFICNYFKGSLTLNQTISRIYQISLMLNENSKMLACSSQYEIIEKNCVILEIGDGYLAKEQKIGQNHNHLVFKPIDEKSNTFCKLLQILGSLYEFGHNPQIDLLYPKVEYPVSRGTPMISPLIKWNHNHDWFVTSYKTQNNLLSSRERIVGISPKDNHWVFVTGHVVDGRNLFPATGYLNLAWEALSLVLGVMKSDMQVVMENCKFNQAANLTKDGKLELTISIQRGTGNFEIIDNKVAVVTGRIYSPSDYLKEEIYLPVPTGPNQNILMETKDIYKELRLRGYNYKGAFRKLNNYDHAENMALIKWDGNWITFMDNMLQIKILQTDTRLLYVPTGIKKFIFDAKRHIAIAKSFGDNPYLPVYYYKHLDIIKCGGIEIRGVQVTSIARRKILAEPVLEKYVFVPNDHQMSLEESIRVNLQIALENSPSIKVKCVELIDEATKANEILSVSIHEVLGNLPLIQPDMTILTKKNLDLPQFFTIEDKYLHTETDCFLVVGTKILQRSLILNQAFGALKPNGYILSRESPDFDTNKYQTSHITVLTIHKFANEKLVLIKRNTKYKIPYVIKISNDNLNWLPILQNAIKYEENLIIYAQNESLSGILGLVNCIRRESGGRNVRCFFIDDEAPPFDPRNDFYEKQLKKNMAINIYKNSTWGTYRHLLLPETTKINREHCYVNVTVRGDLSSLRWMEGPLTSKTILKPEQQLIHVYYSALNFRDVMTASGRINADVITMDRTLQECVQGFEFSGRNSAGERVMGMVTNGALTTLLAADMYLLWPVPKGWTLEEAATIPVVYATAIYCLFVRTKIIRGESVLIHSGSGGVGQAAISICLSQGCTVFTTVGNNQKREFLKKRFPKLQDENIGNSRDTSFEQLIFDRTKGRGVDVIINSLAEDKLQASVRCLSKGGRFFEIGKYDLANNNQLQLLFFQKEASFHGVMVDQIFDEEPGNKKIINQLILKGISDGYIKPLPRTIFEYEEIEEAFRFMSTGKHMGKVVIQIRKEEKGEIVIAPTPQLYRGIPRYCCNENNCYIIVGGLGGFGLELADWLVMRGARKIVLASRKGITNGYQSYRINIWKSYKAKIHISTSDATTEKGCKNLIREAQKLGNVEAIFNLAVVLKDALLENQNVEMFEASLEPKAVATKLLDITSRRFCPNLKHFVVFSSVSCGRGNAGQTNYGMSNSIMERICEQRKKDSLPALAIEWGAIGDVGLVAEMQEANTEIEIGGTLQQKITNCLKVLDTLLNQNDAIVSSMVVAEKRGGTGGADNIVDAVANILGIRDVKTVSFHSNLAELGMDSMTGVEIKQTLEREFEVFLTVSDIRSLTFAKLLEIQEEKISEEETEVKKKEKQLEGLELMLRFINEEPNSKIPVVNLKSRAHKNLDAPQVIFFPGIEGVTKVLEPLLKNLDVRGIGIQFLFNCSENTIEEIASSILPHLEGNISKTKSFNLVAYSYGAIIALEAVGMLEAKGYAPGQIICIDGAPEMLSELIKRQLKLETEAQFQSSLLCAVMAIYMPGETIQKHKMRIQNCTNFEERWRIVEEITPKETPHSREYLKKLAMGLHKRLKALAEYKPRFAKLKSSIKLLKPEHLSVTGLPKDYQLSNLCNNQVEVQIFKGNHVTILENQDLAEVINTTFGYQPEHVKENPVVDPNLRRLSKQILAKQI